MPTKPFYLSKTLWVNVLAALALVLAQFSPVVSTFIQTYFTELGSGWVVVNSILRIISKDTITIS
jgi:hypothetical protein